MSKKRVIVISSIMGILVTSLGIILLNMFTNKVSEVQEERLERELLAVGDWYISQYTKYPLDFPEGLVHIGEEAKDGLLAQLDKEKAVEYFDFATFMTTSGNEMLVDSAPDASEEEEVIYDGLENVFIPDQGIDYGIEELDFTQNDERITIKDGVEVIKIEDLHFPINEVHTIIYNGEGYSLSREDVPYTFDQKVNSSKFKYLFKSISFNDKVAGLTYESLRQDQLLKLSFVLKDGTATSVTVTEGVGEQ